MRRTRLTVVCVLALLVALSAIGVAAGAETKGSSPSQKLQNAVTPAGILQHAQKFQAIADANNGNRASGTPGYGATRAYVVQQLRAYGYKVSVQPFDFKLFTEEQDTTLKRTDVDPDKTYVNGTDFEIMEYSGSGTPEAAVEPVDVTVPPSQDPSSSSGCEAEDFNGFTAGNIALIQRGTCTFAQKAENAETAGASGVIIFNEGNPSDPERSGLLLGTLGEDADVGIPVVGTTFALGEELVTAARNGGATVSISAQTSVETRSTSNVIGRTPTGNANNAVVVGAHIDSVDDGPGLNDDGSGAATTLEIARQMAAKKLDPRRQVRFAFWGAEEQGLVGSTRYVQGLSKKGLGQIALNLDFDMLGSRNFVRFVYDGDGSDTPVAGPEGSAKIEQVFNDYYASRGLQTEPTAFDGRSDYGPFIDVGIPAGGLFSGAEGIKTAEEAQVYGGTAGQQYDPCYHLACDDLDNLSLKSLDQMSDGAADAIAYFGFEKKIFSDATAQRQAAPPSEDQTAYLGNKLQR